MKFLLISIFAFMISSCLGDDKNTTTTTTTTTTATTTTTKPIECGHYNGSCSNCLKASSQCYYCEKIDGCLPLPDKMPFKLPFDGSCPMADVKYKTCAVSLMLLLVCLLSIGGFILLVISCCCIYCCCCRRRKPSRRHNQEMEREMQEEQERHERQGVRRAERESRYDEIRAKYGLQKESRRPVDGEASSSNYQRMGDDHSFN